MTNLAVALLGFGFLIHTFFIGRKAIARKDYGQFGRMIPRVYLFLACMIYILNPPSTVDESIIHLGVALVIVSDLFIAWIETVGNRYYDSKQVVELTELLQKTHNKYVTIIENSQLGFFIMNFDGKIEFANKSFLNIFGCTLSEVINNTIWEHIDPKSINDIKMHLDNKKSGKEKESCYDALFIRKDGTPVKVRLTTIRSDNGHPTVTGSVVIINESQNCSTMEG